MQRYLEIKQPLTIIAGIINAERLFIRADDLFIRRHPFVARLNRALVLSRFDFAETVVDDFAEGLILRPEIESVDRAVSKPKRAMMLMIMVLIRRVLHRPIARHKSLSWPDDGVAVGPGNVGKVIFGE